MRKRRLERVAFEITGLLKLLPVCVVVLSTQGNIHLLFHASGNHYMWSKVTSTVHNIIVGKLWIDQVCRACFIQRKTAVTLCGHACFIFSTVRGHRHCEHHHQGHLPSQVLPVQLFLQGSPTQSKSVGGQRATFQKTDAPGPE